jgi:hypothetical protein
MAQVAVHQAAARQLSSLAEHCGGAPVVMHDLDALAGCASHHALHSTAVSDSMLRYLIVCCTSCYLQRLAYVMEPVEQYMLTCG